jgi:hypothetical protein
MGEAAARRTRSAWPGFAVPLLFAGKGALTRGPYRQSVTTTGALVVWRARLLHDNSANSGRCSVFDWSSARFTVRDFNAGPDPK